MNKWLKGDSLRRPAALLLMLLLPISALFAQQGKTITGTIIDIETQEPLPGVSVLEKGTNNGAATDFDGQFSLELSSEDAVLQLSFVGYQTLEVEVANQTNLSISLNPDMDSLEEVVVIGYGTMKKSNITGAITSVDEKELTQVPSTNVMESLQGKLPGVDITRSSGEAGAGINIAVRGNRSLTASNSPLFIVDGIQYSHIQDLNPNDIESMEVLKDAASTAIYGSRGANGVIIITTKQGTVGQTKVNFNAYAGVSEVVNYPKVMTPHQLADYRREANRATGNWSGPGDDSSIFTDWEMDAINNNGGTIWPDLFLNRGHQQDYQVGVSTATERTRFYVSLNYFNEQGNRKMDELNRYSVRANIDHDINDKITIGSQNQITYYNQNYHRDPMNMANKMNPFLRTHDEQGNVEFMPFDYRDVNPLIDMEPGHYENNNRTTRVFTSAYFDYDIFENFNFRSNLGVTLQNNRRGIYRASETIDRAGQGSEAVYETGNDIGINWENIINYNTSFGGGDHSLALTGVQSYINGQNEGQSARGRNQLLDYQLFHSLGNASEQLAIQSDYEESTLISFTGRVQYDYKDKYIFMATARTDGASQLGDGNKWAFFPSVSGAWRLIEEDFMADSESFTDLKLRASYGVAGNAAVDPYSTQSLLNRIPFGFNEEPAIGYAFASTIGNNDLGWEISKTYNLGVDFGLFRNRISGSVDVYNTRTDDLLLDRLLPATSGVRRITENVGATSNKGVEVSLNTTPVQRGIVKWDVGINWFTNKEEILELATGSDDIANGWFIGQPTQAFYDYEKAGIWQSGQEAEAAQYGQEPGEIRVVDQNNDGQIDSTNDRVILGSTRPDWSGSLTSDLTVGNFDLNVQLFARVGQMMDFEFYDIYDPSGLGNNHNHDYWTPENPTNAYPRPNAGRQQGSVQYYSSVLYEKASFLKLRNVTLGYNLPKSILDNLGISRLRIYATGRNLLVITKVDDYDPERGGAMSNPIPRLFVGGINIEL